MVQVIFRRENCSLSQDLENISILRSTTIPLVYARVIIQVVNLVLNSISFFIFSADKSEDKQVRFCLRLLSLTEILLALSKQHELVFIIMMYVPLSPTSALVLAKFLMVLEAIHYVTLCRRNFLVALISCSRAEVVARPMARRSGRQFLTSRVFLTLFFIYIGLSVILRVLVSLSISKVPVFEFCEETARLLSYHYNNKANVLSWEIYLIVIEAMVILMSPIPILIVMLATAVMLFSLRRSLKFGGTCDKQKQRALRLILLLSILFIVFEMPTVAYAIIFHETDLASSEREMVIYNVITLLSTLDSTNNFFVYFFSTKAFREKFKCWKDWLCDGLMPLCDYFQVHDSLNFSFFLFYSALFYRNTWLHSA